MKKAIFLLVALACVSMIFGQESVHINGEMPSVRWRSEIAGTVNGETPSVRWRSEIAGTVDGETPLIQRNIETVPYSQDFETLVDDGFPGWTFSTNRLIVGGAHGTSQGVGIQLNASNLNGVIRSPQVSIIPGTRLKFSYRAVTNTGAQQALSATNFINIFAIIDEVSEQIGRIDNTNHTTQAGWVDFVLPLYMFDGKTVQIQWQPQRGSGDWQFHFDEVQFQEPFDFDIMAEGISGALSLPTNRTTTHTISVINIGSQTASGYRVRLLANNQEIASVPGIPLISGANIGYPFDWVPTNPGVVNLVGVVEWATDMDPVNNITTAFVINVTDEVTLPYVPVFDGIDPPTGWEFYANAVGHPTAGGISFSSTVAGEVRWAQTPFMGPLTSTTRVKFSYKAVTTLNGTTTVNFVDPAFAEFGYMLNGEFFQIYRIDSTNHTPTSNWTERIVDIGTDIPTTLIGETIPFRWRVHRGTVSIFFQLINVEFYNATPYPAAANIVSPAHNAINVELSSTLNWTPSNNSAITTGYKVWFGTNPNSLTEVQDSAATSYSPTLANDTVYYWRIQPYAGTQLRPINECPIWHFSTSSTKPLQAILNHPFDNADFMTRRPNLIWSPNPAGVVPTSYNVYYIQESQYLLSGFTGVTPVLVNAPTTNYTISTELPAFTKYYWQVVPVNAAGASIVPPTVFSFTTADNLFQIGHGNGAIAQPMQPMSRVSYSQSIYHASEISIASPRLITEIQYFYTSNSAWTNSRQWEIRMGHTSKEHFDSETFDQFVPFDQLQPVFDTLVAGSPARRQWMPIKLETPFFYNGVDNLVIAVWEKDFSTAADFDGATRQFLGTETGTFRSIMNRSDTDGLLNPLLGTAGPNWNLPGDIQGFPNTRILFEPLPVAATMVLSPSAHSFPTVNMPFGAEEVFTLSNLGATAYRATNLAITGADQSQFSVEFITPSATTIDIKDETQVQFKVTYQPTTVTIGDNRHRATVVLTHTNATVNGLPNQTSTNITISGAARNVVYQGDFPISIDFDNPQVFPPNNWSIHGGLLPLNNAPISFLSNTPEDMGTILFGNYTGQDYVNPNGQAVRVEVAGVSHGRWLITAPIDLSDMNNVNGLVIDFDLGWSSTNTFMPINPTAPTGNNMNDPDDRFAVLVSADGRFKDDNLAAVWTKAGTWWSTNFPDYNHNGLTPRPWNTTSVPVTGSRWVVDIPADVDDKIVQIAFYWESRANTPAATSYYFLDNIRIMERVMNDLELMSLSGKDSIGLTETSTFTASVRNQGHFDVAANTYKVSLYKVIPGPSNSLIEVLVSEVTTTPAIAFGTTANINLTYTPEPTDPQFVDLIAIAEFNTGSDATPENNRSRPLHVEIALKGTISSYAGNGSMAVNANFPFNYVGRNSCSQSIYYPDNFAGLVAGDVIHTLTWEFVLNPNPENQPPSDRVHTIWMANTTKDTFTANMDWVPMEELTLVYHGTFDLSKRGPLKVVLDTPFEYTGGNFVVASAYNWMENDPRTFSSNSWWHWNNGVANRSLIMASGTAYPIVFFGDNGTRPAFLPLLTLGFTPQPTGILNGVVNLITPPNDGINRVQDIELTINGTSSTTSTNATGDFTFDNFPIGTGSITAQGFWIQNTFKTGITLSSRNPIGSTTIEAPLRTNLSPFSGTVKDTNGVVIEEATVLVKGPFNFELPIQTNNAGVFTSAINLPNNHLYTLSVSKPGYATVTVDFEFPISTGELDFVLNYDNADFEALALTGPSRITEGVATTYQAHVRYNGSSDLPANTYTVKLMAVRPDYYPLNTRSLDHVEIAHITATPELKAGEIILLPLTFTPTTQNFPLNFDLYALVDFDPELGIIDTNMDNNASPVLNTTLLAATTIITTSVSNAGDGTTTRTALLPFSYNIESSYVQSIYYPTNFTNLEAGKLIHSLTYDFHEGNPTLNDNPLSIFMGHTTKTEFDTTTDYIPHDTLTLVWTGTVDLSVTGEKLFILDTPFLYEGGNFVIATQRHRVITPSLTLTVQVNHTWYNFSDGVDNRSLGVRINNAEINPSIDLGVLTANTRHNFLPVVTLAHYSPLPIGTLTGKLSLVDRPGGYTPEELTRVSNVIINLNGSPRNVMTNATGDFVFPDFPAQRGSISARSFWIEDGFFGPVNMSGTPLTAVANFSVPLRPLTSITGKIVCDIDNIGIDNVYILVDGPYDYFAAGYTEVNPTGTERGVFNFPNVPEGHTFTLTIIAPGYERQTVEYKHPENNFVVALTETYPAPYMVRANYTGGEVLPHPDDPILRTGDLRSPHSDDLRTGDLRSPHSVGTPGSPEINWFGVETSAATLTKSNLVYSTNVGSGASLTWTIAHRYTPTDILRNNLAGLDIHSVSFYAGGPGTFTVRFYETDTETQTPPLTNYLSQQIVLPIQVLVNNWNHVQLDTPHNINPDKYLWIAILTTPQNSSATFVSGADNGPVIPGGDWIFLSTTWSSLAQVGVPGRNWLIYAEALDMATGVTRNVAANSVRHRTDGVPPSTRINGETPFVHSRTDGETMSIQNGDRRSPVQVNGETPFVQMPPVLPKTTYTPRNTSRHVSSYNIYRAVYDIHGAVWTQLNDAPITETTYYDTSFLNLSADMAGTEFYYKVEANYHNGEVLRETTSNTIQKDPTTTVVVTVSPSTSASVTLTTASGSSAYYNRSIYLDETSSIAQFTGVNLSGKYIISVESEDYILETLEVEISPEDRTFDISLTPFSGFLLSESFENQFLPPNWLTLQPPSSTGLLWKRYTSEQQEHSMSSQQGNSIAYSESFNRLNNTSLTPDNWLITPGVTIHSGEVINKLAFYVAAARSANMGLGSDPTPETYSVYAVTVAQYEQLAAGTNVQNTLTAIQTQGILTNQVLTNWLWQPVVIDLEEYAGERIHFAFRHHDSTGNYALKLDNVRVFTNAPDIIHATPTDFAGRIVGLNAVLSWVAPTTHLNATLSGYNIYRDGIVVNTVGATELSATDGPLSPQTSYVYNVSAIYTNFDGESELTEPITITTSTLSEVLPPANLNYTLNGNVVTLTWQAPTRADDFQSPSRSGDFQSPPRSGDFQSPSRSGDFQSPHRSGDFQSPPRSGDFQSPQRWRSENTVTSSNRAFIGYHVYRTDTLISGDTPITTLTYTDNAPNGWHIYRVTAVYDFPATESDPAEVTVFVGQSTLNPPRVLQGIAYHGYNQISWTAPAAGSTHAFMHYRIYRNGDLLQDTFTSTNFTDSNVESATTYNYHITAIYGDELLESLPSNTLTLNSPGSPLIVPSKFSAEFTGSSMVLDWAEPTHWLTHSNLETDDGAIGNASSSTTWTVAQRFTSQHLQSLGVENAVLTHVQFYSGSPGYSAYQYVIQIYSGGSGGATYNSGQLIHSQSVPNSGFHTWNNITLSTPVAIPEGQELWIGYSVTQVNGGYPLTYDTAPMALGFGNLILNSGTWTTIDTFGDFTNNWIIAGLAAHPDGTMISLNPVPAISDRHCTDGVSPLMWRSEIAATVDGETPFVHSLSLPHVSSNSSVELPLTSTTLEKHPNSSNSRQSSPFNTRAVLGYKVYRNNVALTPNPVSQMSFTDTNITVGNLYEYGVTAVYEEGESIPATIPVWSNFFYPPNNLSGTGGGGLVFLLWEVPEGEHMGTVAGYRVYRDNNLITSSLVTNLYYSDETVIDGMSYNYYVTTVYTQSNIESLPSNAVNVKVDVISPPANLSADVAGYDVTLSWDAPQQPVNFTQANGDTFAGGFMLTTQGSYPITWSVAHRYTVAQLASLGAAGGTLTRVGFIPNLTVSEYSIKIWTGSNAPTEAGNLVHEQSVSNDLLTSQQWNDFLLSAPVQIPTNQELWIGLTFIQPLDGSPIGRDAGPANVGFGNKIERGAGNWEDLSALGNFNFNWLIKATAMVSFPDENESYELEFDATRGLLGYVVKRDGRVLTPNPITARSFTDYEVPIGTYIYHVSAIYDGGESEPAEVGVQVVSEIDNGIIPLFTELKYNYPNPFNPETTIHFSVATKSSSPVFIDVYNLRGQKIRTLVNEVLDIGNYSVVWNGKDDNGRNMSSGIYFYRLQTNDYTNTKRMVLMK